MLGHHKGTKVTEPDFWNKYLLDLKRTPRKNCMCRKKSGSCYLVGTRPLELGAMCASFTFLTYSQKTNGAEILHGPFLSW